MDSRQLKYFVQIVESGSLSKAARELFIAQPALSFQVARLEREVGKPLLVRSARGVTPTANGEALYHHAKMLLRQFEDATAIARQEYADIKGRVTVGLTPTTACVLGLPLLEHIQRKQPGIVLNVVAIHSTYLEDMARAGRIDVGISKTAASDLHFEPLFEEDLFLMVPVDSRLVPNEKTSITLAEVAALPLILPSPDHDLRRRIAMEFGRAGLHFDARAEIDSLLLAMRYCGRDKGVMIQPMAAAVALDAPQLWRFLAISDVQLSRTSYLFSRPTSKLTAGASVVRSELKRVVNTLVESNAWPGVRVATEPLHTCQNQQTSTFNATSQGPKATT